MMVSFLKSLLALIFLLACHTNAQTFQAPMNGTYSCVSSQESPIDENAQRIGTLSVSATTYTFMVGQNSESGSLTAREENIADTFPFSNSGSSVILQSQNGITVVGFYVVDQLGGSYLFMQNANGVWIRCDSAGADIFAAVNGGNSSSESRTDNLGDLGAIIPTLTPLTAVAPGTYSCYRKSQYANPDPFYDNLEGSTKLTDIQLFDTGEFKDNDPEYSFEADGFYSFDATTGVFELPESGYGETFQYGSVNNTPTFFWHEVREGNYYDEDYNAVAGTDYEVLECSRVGDVTGVPPSVAATEEYNLQPASVKAPLPPTGAGGLTGFFVNTEFVDDTITTYDMNGLPMTQNTKTQVDKELFFFPDGYVVTNVYQWGLSEVDCSRVYKDGKHVCGTYVVKGNTITINYPDGEVQAETFSKEQDGIYIGDAFYFYRESVATDFKLDGYYSRNYFTGTTSGSVAYHFYPDGTFTDESGSTYISVTNVGGTSSGTVITSDCTGSVGGTTSTTEGVGTVSVETETSRECLTNGTYEIRGYDLIMKFANGKQQTLFLSTARDETGEVSTIYINQEIFWSKE